MFGSVYRVYVRMYVSSPFGALALLRSLSSFIVLYY